MARTTKKTTDPAKVRAAVEALDHHDAYLLAFAAQTYAAALTIDDSRDPSPEKRADAERLTQLAEFFGTVNTARHYLATGDR